MCVQVRLAHHHSQGGPKREATKRELNDETKQERNRAKRERNYTINAT